MREIQPHTIQNCMGIYVGFVAARTGFPVGSDRIPVVAIRYTIECCGIRSVQAKITNDFKGGVSSVSRLNRHGRNTRARMRKINPQTRNTGNTLPAFTGPLRVPCHLANLASPDQISEIRSASDFFYEILSGHPGHSPALKS